MRRLTAGVVGLTLVGIGVNVAADAAASTPPSGSSEPSTSGAATTTTSMVTPSTTLDGVAAEEAAVSAAAVAARTARMDALINPDDHAVVASLDTYYVADGAARAEIDARIAAMREERLTVVANPDVPDALTVEAVVLADGPPSTAAQVTACVLESGTYFSDATETSQVLVGDEYRAFRAVYAMVNANGTWKVDTATFVDEWPGETTCAPPPPTTTTPPTTLDPIVAEEALVARRVHEIQAVRLNAYINLDAPGNAEAIGQSYTEGGEALAVLESDLQTLREQGWRARDNPGTPTTLTIESVRFLDGMPPTRADVVVCQVNSGIVYEPNSGPNGEETIVNDDITTYYSIQHMVLIDEVWKLDNVEDVDSWPGAVQCPPE